jgi:hypothetical protein
MHQLVAWIQEATGVRTPIHGLHVWWQLKPVRVKPPALLELALQGG